MPKKSLNNDIVNEYLDHIKKDNEKKLSKQTLKTYENIGNNLPFNILTNQNTIIKKLKEVYENPNTLALYLNMIILVRKFKDQEVDKLIKFRNQLRDKIIEERKNNLDKLDDTLPKLNVINEELDNLVGLPYIVNYLVINHGLRNKDMNLKFMKTFDRKIDENQIRISGKKALLLIKDYKTDKTFGEKEIEVKNEKFLKELKSLKLSDGDYLIPMKNGDKVNNLITFNDKVKKLTIMNLGQNKLVKIVIKDLLNNKNFNKLEKLSQDRGTSIQVLLSSYNLHNGNDDEKK